MLGRGRVGARHHPYYKPGQFSSLAGPEAPTSEGERIELLDVVRGFAFTVFSWLTPCGVSQEVAATEA